MKATKKLIFNIIFFTALAALLLNDFKKKINILSVLLILGIITAVFIIISLFIKNKRFGLCSVICCLSITFVTFLCACFFANDDYGKLGIILALIPGIAILFLGLLIYAVITLVKKEKRQ